MKLRLVLATIVASFGPAASAQNQSADRMPSYPIEIAPEKVYEYGELNIGARDLRLSANTATVVPISCERGITGLVLIGNGTFRYTPKGHEPIAGQFRAAMLRFNPEDQASIVPLDKGRKVIDQGAAEMSRHLLSVVFRHCWHSGQQALIPPKGSISAVLYSKDHGDLLISDDKQTAVVFNFTERKTLYQKK
jgi:hypothetical protein